MSSDQEARARELLDRTWSRLNPAAAAATATAPTTLAPTPIVTPGVPATQPATAAEGRAQEQIEQLNADARKRALDAAQQRSRKDVIRDLQKDAEAVASTRTPPPARSNPTPPPAQIPNVKNRAPAPAGTPPPRGGPATLSSKQQRLTELLEAYKGDKISPAEYHAQRAKILAEP
jgi:hypothetical protein